VERLAEPVERLAEPVERLAEPVERPAEPVERLAEPVERLAEPVERLADRAGPRAMAAVAMLDLAARPEYGIRQRGTSRAGNNGSELMQLKVYTIELNPPSWLRKVLVYVGLPVGVLLGSAMAVRAGVTLTTFTAGSAIKAADVNANFAALQGAIPQLTQWTSYTPQITTSTGGTLTSDTTYSGSRWRRVGDSVEINIESIIPTCTASGAIRWSVPNGLQMDNTKVSGANAQLGTGAAPLTSARERSAV
jgi:hypothetical protein